MDTFDVIEYAIAAAAAAVAPCALGSSLQSEIGRLARITHEDDNIYGPCMQLPILFRIPLYPHAPTRRHDEPAPGRVRVRLRV